MLGLQAFTFDTYTVVVNETDISQNIFVKGFVKAVLWNSHCQPLAERPLHIEETTKQFLSDFSIFRECHYIFRLRKDRESYFPREEYNCFVKKVQTSVKCTHQEVYFSLQFQEKKQSVT